VQLLGSHGCRKTAVTGTSADGVIAWVVARGATRSQPDARPGRGAVTAQLWLAAAVQLPFNSREEPLCHKQLGRLTGRSTTPFAVMCAACEGGGEVLSSWS
jgi:hypothetical protein